MSSVTPVERPTRRLTAEAVCALAAGSCALLLTGSSAEAATPVERNATQEATATTATVELAFGVWTVFGVGATGSSSQVFTFTSPTPVLLRVTDSHCRGDEYRVFDRGYALFNTSTVGTDPSCDGVPHVETAPAAWLDQSYSKGRFLLQPGQHAVRMRITDSPFGAAGSWIRIDKRPVR